MASRRVQVLKSIHVVAVAFLCWMGTRCVEEAARWDSGVCKGFQSVTYTYLFLHPFVDHFRWF